MPLATMREMIEIGETEANLDEKEWSALLKFQISSENFDSQAKAMIVTEILFLCGSITDRIDS